MPYAIASEKAQPAGNKKPPPQQAFCVIREKQIIFRPNNVKKLTIWQWISLCGQAIIFVKSGA